MLKCLSLVLQFKVFHVVRGLGNYRINQVCGFHYLTNFRLNRDVFLLVSLLLATVASATVPYLVISRIGTEEVF